MARSAAAQKPSLVTTAQIPVAPLDRFAIAPENPRKIRSEDWIHELAASLASSGVITPVICYDEGGKLQITAGGTRFLAAKHARLDGLPYDVCSKEIAISAGLVEQEGHSPLHPADQAEAYAAELARMKGRQDHGSGDTANRANAVLQIANRGGKTVRFVEQRLALAGLHPPILKALREDKLSLDQASAWANAPAERQADVWKDLGARALRLDTRGIRAVLDKADLAEDDRLVKFAGRARYAAAGGMIRQDLFPIDVTGEVKLDAKPAEHFDREAVKAAAKARLEEEAEKYRKQGWGFVLTKAGSVLGAPSGYTIGKACTTKEQKAKAGVSLSIGYDGKLVTQLHLRKQAEKKPAAAAAEKASAKAAEAEAERERFDLTCAYAEQIVGRSLYEKPELALSALLAAMAQQIMIDGYRVWADAPLLNVDVGSNDRDAEGLISDIAARKTVDHFHDELNADRENLISAIYEMSTGERNRLLCLIVTSVMDIRLGRAQVEKHPRAQQISTLGRLAGASLDDHVTNDVLAKVDLPLLRQLVGLEALSAPKKKPAAKAKKSRGSK